MSDVREFANAMAIKLIDRSREFESRAYNDPTASGRNQMLGRAEGFSKAAVMVLEAIPEGK